MVKAENWDDVDEDADMKVDCEIEVRAKGALFKLQGWAFADALAKLQELSARTERFATFRSSFQSVDVGPEVDPLNFPPSRFSQIPEISLIMRDSQAAMGQVSSDLKRAEFRLVANEVLDQERISRVRTGDAVSGIADEKIAEELLSWRNVISDIQARVTGGR